MRTRDEMKAVLHRIEAAWAKAPMMRLGQLISNAVPEGSDLFYAEDDKLVATVEDFAGNVRAARALLRASGGRP